MSDKPNKIKLTVFNNDGTEDIFISRSYLDGHIHLAGGHTSNGYQINLEDGSSIIVHPTTVRRIKIEYIK